MNAEALVTRGVRRIRNLFPVAPRPVILMYHRVAIEAFDPWGLAVSPTNFAGHLKLLRQTRTVVSLPEFAAAHLAGTLPGNAAAITFDDGYACNKEVAAPLLHGERLPATIFIAAAQIESGAPFWWDELAPLVLATEAAALEIGQLKVELGPQSKQDGLWRPGAPPSSPRQQVFLQIWSHLSQKPAAEIALAMAHIRAQAAVRERPICPRLISPSDVKLLASDVIEFGSHALTHPSLPSLPAAEKAREIKDSVGRCEALSGSAPRSFAYPFGDRDTESEKLVDDAGFECACSTDHQAVAQHSRPFALPRLAIGNSSAAVLNRVLKGAPE